MTSAPSLPFRPLHSPSPPSSPSWSRSSISFLTPSSGAAADVISPSAGLNGTSSHSSQAEQHAQYSYATPMTGGWSAAGGNHQHSSYTFANSSQAPVASSLVQSSPYTQRAPSSYGNTLSPPLPHFSGRSGTTSANGDSISGHHSYQDHHQHYSGGIGGTMGSTQTSGPPPLGGISQSIMTSQTATLSQPPTPGQAAHSIPPPLQESYRPPQSQTGYYSTAPTPQQSSYAFSGPPQQQSPTATSPTSSTGALARNMTSISSMPPMSFGNSRQHMSGVPPYSYSNVGGSVLSNMHQPGTPMSMMPMTGMSYGHAGMHHSYQHAPQGHASLQQTDRPFRCDVCTTSFNRNHDLKRHKRIHLTTKPYPCTFCDKAFSRKDALKVCRHPCHLAMSFWELAPLIEATMEY